MHSKKKKKKLPRVGHGHFEQELGEKQTLNEKIRHRLKQHCRNLPERIPLLETSAMTKNDLEGA